MSTNTGSKLDLSGQKIDGGRYIVRQQLGAGGMGTVWLATARMGTDVVLKFPHEAMFSQAGFKERFQIEMDSLSKLSHRHQGIVTILDVGVHNELPFVVMQYLSGGSLDDRKDRFRIAVRNGKNLKRLFRWLDEISDALDFVHAKSVVHRDVKPMNILFDDAGGAYLTDFGIAKVLSENSLFGHVRAVTQTTQIVGTLEYMAHELLMGTKFDGKIDQYALAVTVYELLAGERPFRGPTPSAVSEKQKVKPADIHLLCSTMNQGVSAVLNRALAASPESRFRSCSEFASAFLHVLEQHGAAGATEEEFVEAVLAEEVNGDAPRSDPRKIETNTAPIASAKVETTSEKTAAKAKRPAKPVQRAKIPKPKPSVPRRPPAKQSATPQAAPKLKTPPQPKPSGRPVFKKPSKKTATPERAAEHKADQPSRHARPPGRERKSEVPQQQPAQPVASASWRSKKITCPWCWHQFSPRDLLWIAEHDELRGDPKLGDVPQRFLPDVFTADCRAIDASGQVCHRTACPRCHLIVPQAFVDYEPIFLSVLGVPTSGKTCFLAAMTWQLRNVLPTAFRYSFTDADTELNQILIQNEQIMFLSSSRDLVRLQKTQPEGDGYQYVKMGGREVKHVQPFVFSLRPAPSHPNHHSARNISYAVCLYDHPGEHFLPGRDIPATRHLASSDALIFVFDPSQHPRFRAACESSTSDPQFHEGYYPQIVRQETVLIETMNRIRRYGNLSLHERYDKPLIVVVNKYDAWAARFQGVRLSNPWGETKKDFPASVDNTRIRSNSKKMRELLTMYCPEVVAAAEDFAADVTYVPVSSFGRRVESDAKTNADGVRCDKLEPMWVEVPVLNVMSRIRRGVIPKV